MVKWHGWLALALLAIGTSAIPAQEEVANTSDCNTCQTGCKAGCWDKLVDFLTYRPLRVPCDCRSILWPSQTCTPSVYEFFRYRPGACGFNATHPGSSLCGAGCKGCSKCRTGGCADGSCNR